MKKYSSIITLTIALAISTPVFYAFSTPVAPAGKDARGTLAILFSGMKNFGACSGQFIVTGFDALSKVPQCKTRDNFLKDYFKTQSSVVPAGNIVTGFDVSGVMTSSPAQGMVRQVMSTIPGPASSMQGLVGFTATNPVYTREIGYWENNGGAGIKYEGSVNVGGFLGGQINTTEVKSSTTASASNHLMNRAQFMGDMQTMCADINGDWNGSTCIPRNCSSVPTLGTKNHNTWNMAYQNLTVPFGQTCKSENRFCRNGSLSGSYMQADCYYWTASGFPAAAQSCGSETVSQTVRCMQSSTNSQVADGLCDAPSKPPVNKTYTHDPCPINCVGTWSGYGSCSASCGPGTKSRTFTQTVAAQHGGASCTSIYGVEDGGTDSTSCNEGACATYRWKDVAPSGCMSSSTSYIGDSQTGYEDYENKICPTPGDTIKAGARDRYGFCPVGEQGIMTLKCLP